MGNDGRHWRPVPWRSILSMGNASADGWNRGRRRFSIFQPSIGLHSIGGLFRTRLFSKNLVVNVRNWSRILSVTLTNDRKIILVPFDIVSTERRKTKNWIQIFQRSIGLHSIERLFRTQFSKNFVINIRNWLRSLFYHCDSDHKSYSPFCCQYIDRTIKSKYYKYYTRLVKK